MEQKKRQRSQDRICCSAEVLINDSFVCRALDISEGGMYLLSDRVFVPGSVIKVTLDTGKEKIELKARVKHVAEGLGLGLMFIDLNDLLKKKIREFVQETRSRDFSTR